MERIIAVARGKVQGVGYRQYISECARRLGVHGQVTNLPDGTVRVVAESSPSTLADLIRLARAEGHPLIHVETFEIKKEPATGEFKGFWVDW